MSKIICDVCGTSYPESVSQCPICGCVRSVDSRIVPGKETESPQSVGGSSYTFVKGGRFSKSNVKKRQKVRAKEQSGEDEQLGQENDQKKADKGLLVAFIVLLLAVFAVICYIFVKILTPDTVDPNSGNQTQTPETNPTTVSTVQTDPVVPCEEIELNQTTVTLEQVGGTYQINATLTPADTTDKLLFESSDSNVATVTADGLVTAVGEGETTITVSCGEESVTCTVKIELPTQPTDPVVPADFKLNREDFTLMRKGESHNLYSGSIPADQIIWKSSKPGVATVKNGRVTAVSNGSTTITAEYNGVTLSCIARVRISEE